MASCGASCSNLTQQHLTTHINECHAHQCSMSTVLFANPLMLMIKCCCVVRCIMVSYELMVFNCCHDINMVQQHNNTKPSATDVHWEARPCVALAGLLCCVMLLWGRVWFHVSCCRVECNMLVDEFNTVHDRGLTGATTHDATTRHCT